MKTLQRHWLATATVACVLVILVGAAAWRVLWQAEPAFAGEPTYEPVDRVTRDAVLDVLDKVSLDRDAMIALNLSANQGESVIGGARTWYTQNAETLETLRQTIHARTHALRTVREQVATGPAPEGHAAALALAVSDLRAAEAAYDAALNPLRSSVGEMLSESQRTTWTAIRTGHGQQMPIRMLALTDEQRSAVSKAQRHFEWQRASNPAAAEAWQTALQGILTQEQQTLVAGYHANYAGASANVAGAMQAVLQVAQP